MAGVTSVSTCITARYRDGISEGDEIIRWLWQTLDSFTNEEKVLFLRFVSGWLRLPARVSEIIQHDRGRAYTVKGWCGGGGRGGLLTSNSCGDTYFVSKKPLWFLFYDQSPWDTIP